MMIEENKDREVQHSVEKTTSILQGEEAKDDQRLETYQTLRTMDIDEFYDENNIIEEDDENLPQVEDFEDHSAAHLLLSAIKLENPTMTTLSQVRKTYRLDLHGISMTTPSGNPHTTHSFTYANIHANNFVEIEEPH